MSVAKRSIVVTIAALGAAACTMQTAHTEPEGANEPVATTSSELGGVRCNHEFECKDVGGEKVGVKAKVGPVKTGAKVKIFAGPNKRDDAHVTLVNHYYKDGQYQCCAVKQSHGDKITKMMDGRIEVNWGALVATVGVVLAPGARCIAWVSSLIQGGEVDADTPGEVAAEIATRCGYVAGQIADALDVQASPYDGVRAVVRVENDGEVKEWSDKSGKVPSDGLTAAFCPAERACAP